MKILTTGLGIVTKLLPILVNAATTPVGAPNSISAIHAHLINIPGIGMYCFSFAIIRVGRQQIIVNIHPIGLRNQNKFVG